MPLALKARPGPVSVCLAHPHFSGFSRGSGLDLTGEGPCRYRQVTTKTIIQEPLEPLALHNTSQDPKREA